MTLLYYFKHWSNRRLSSTDSSLIEGEYFKHYIPEKLRDEYDRKKNAKHRHYAGKIRSYIAKFVSLTTLVAAIGVSTYSLLRNSGTLLQPIDLSSKEISSLDYTQHQWYRDIDYKLPQLSNILSNYSDKGFILPYDQNDDNWLFNGKNIREIANQQWLNFSQRNNFKTITCQWDRLFGCQKAYKNWIVLVLPGLWDLGALDSALMRGANVIVYGPPAQIDKNPAGLDWQDIKFRKIDTKESGEIILRGDQLLTLNFDAGLILDTFSAFTGFQVYSENAQAVTFDATYETEKNKGTRLFAKSVGQGRLVWLDFAPDAVDHSLDINVTHLNAIVASIFRYFSRIPYSSVATWPKGRIYAALVDEDTEYRFTNAGKVVDLAKKYNIPISWYILSDEALKHRKLTSELTKSGEIACHGDNHGVFTLSTKKEQVVRIARCKKVLTLLTGIEPMSFRPPEEKFNSSTIDAIANNDMDHYIAVNSPDRAVPEMLISLTNGKSLVSIPRMINDDYELWHKRKLNYRESISIFEGETEWSRFIGGVHMFSFHTQYIDDSDHVQALEYLFDRLKKSGAYFETSTTISKWWRVHENLNQGLTISDDLAKKYGPVILTVNANGVLTKSEYRK